MGMYISDVISFLSKKYGFTYEDICEDIEAFAIEKARKRKDEIKSCVPHIPRATAGKAVFCDKCPYAKIVHIVLVVV